MSDFEWRDVDKELPNRGGYYIACWKFEHIITTGEVWWGSSGWVHPHYGGDEKENPPKPPKILYWMKMPLPPIQSIAKGGE